MEAGNSVGNDIFAPDFRAEPFWWRETPVAEAADGALPDRCDVLVIGSGYTGLCAALETARAGRHTVVIDKQTAGWGCSSRNGGQVSMGIGVSHAELARSYGEDTAYAIVREGHNALGWIEQFTEREGIRCDFRKCGRLFGAHTPRMYDYLVKKYCSPSPKGLETDSFAVPKSEQANEIDTAFYHGCVVNPRNASVDPARFHHGMLERVQTAGAMLVTGCEALEIAGAKGNWQIRTSTGTIAARDVVVATNGYTGKASPWLQKRVIPLASYMLATEQLPQDVIDRLLPKDRMVVDTRQMVVYYRTCPKRERIIFGGRVSTDEPDADVMAPALHREMVRIFPELKETRIINMWMGYVGFSFDYLPHLGCQDGIYYSMAYCGSGIAMAGYLGTKIGLQIIGSADGDSPLMRAPFQSRFYYTGNPWFMRPALSYYKLRDRIR
jgi:glycine/D-amino acid oxidase-like deaminating enzyme